MIDLSIRSNDRFYLHCGYVYLFRDIWIGRECKTYFGSARGEYDGDDVVDADPTSGEIFWTECKQNAEFSDVRPLCGVTELLLSATNAAALLKARV